MAQNYLTMDIYNIITLIVTTVLGGGCLVALVTLKATRAKANEDVEKAKIDNAKALLELNKEYIVQPVTTKINGLEKTIKKLERAVNKSKDCAYTDNCPVRNELQKHEDSNGQ